MSNQQDVLTGVEAIGLPLPCGCTPERPCHACVYVAEADHEATKGCKAGLELVASDTPPKPKYRLDAETQCWVWIGAKNQQGYGSTRYAGRAVAAHRAFFAHYVERIPPGMLVRHDCDNPSCVNPDHLRLGTALDNMRDRDQRKRRTPPRGENHASSKLTEADVKEIHRLTRLGVRQKDIAARFGVNPVTIHWVQYGKTWAHLHPDAKGA